AVSPTYGIESTSTGGFGYGTRGINTSGFCVGAGGEHNGSGYGVLCYNSGGGYGGYFSGSVYTTGSYLPSDEKLKDNIRNFTENSVELLQKINIKSYSYRNDGEFKSMNLPKDE